MKLSKSGISIIEVIVAIFIFSMGLAAIYMTISSSISVNDYNKNQIIGTNLAREGIELVKNLRDSNYKNMHNWNSMNPNITTDFTNPINLIHTGTYYKISANYETSGISFSVKLDKINPIDFGEGVSLLNTKMKSYELCLDLENRYIYGNCSLSGLKKTGFYRYIKFEPLMYKNASGDVVLIGDSYKVISKVIWFHRGYHETSLTTILADFKRL